MACCVKCMINADAMCSRCVLVKKMKRCDDQDDMVWSQQTMFKEIYGDGVHEVDTTNWSQDDIPQPEEVLIQEENPHIQAGGGGIFAKPQLDRRNVVQTANNFARYLFQTIMLINIFQSHDRIL